jgi:hypothetical protein
MEVLSLSILISQVLLFSYSATVGTAFGWIEWSQTALVIVFWPYACFAYFNQIPNISYYLSHILFIFPKKLPWPKSKPHSIVKTAAHARWQGPAEWNTLVEEVGEKAAPAGAACRRSSLSRKRTQNHNASHIDATEVLEWILLMQSSIAY